MKKTYSVLVIVGIWVFGFVRPVLSQVLETPICTNSYGQFTPVVSGDWILWIDWRHGSYDVYMYALTDSSETRITSVASNKMYLSVSGSRVIWQDNRNGDWDIYYYDISNPGPGVYPIIDFPGDQEYPAICDSFLVWSEGDPEELYLYNINTADIDMITSGSSGPQVGGSISGHRVAWSNYPGGSIWVHNIYTGESREISATTDGQNPVIADGRVFWWDWRHGNDDIYMNHLLFFPGAIDLEWPLSLITIDRYLPDPLDQRHPHAMGDHLVFEQFEEGNWNIYSYYFYNPLWGTLTPVCTAEDDQINAYADGERVVWQDYRNGNADIYMWERPPGTDLCVTKRDAPSPVKVGSYLTYTVDAVNLGPGDASGVVLTDTIPYNVDLFSYSCTHGMCSQAGREITCNIDSLLSGEAATLTIIVKTTRAGEICNKATVTGNEVDLVQLNNYHCLRTIVRYFVPVTIDEGGAPSIAIDHNDKVHIAYLGDPWGGELRYATNTNGWWETRTLDNSEDIQSSAIVVDASGNVHISYVDFDWVTARLKYTNNIGGSWQPAETLVENDDGCWPLSMGIDSSDNIHIGYREATGLAYNAPLKYVTNESGSWVVDSVGDNIRAYDYAAIAADDAGNVHFSYYAINQGLKYVTDAPDGTWQTPDTVDLNWSGGQLEGMVTDIVIDGLNRPHISYVSGGGDPRQDTWYAVKTGGVWNTTLIDSGEFISFGNRIDVDSDGNPHLLYYHSLSNELRYAYDTSGVWERKFVEGGADFSEWEDGNVFGIVTDSRGKVHLAYSIGGKVVYTTNADYSVHYGGGEDGSGGYYFANSTSGGAGSPSQPTYEWIDPVVAGHNEITSWTLGDGDNGYYGPVGLGLSFLYFDNMYTGVYINSNGYVSFDYGYDTSADNTFIPDVFAPNNMIAGCAMDLDVTNGTYPDAHVYYGGDADQSVITYIHAHNQGSVTDYITFQIILYPNGNIKIQYNEEESTDPLPASIESDALVGIENWDGSKGLQYRNDGAGGPLFGSPLAVQFGLNNALLPVEEERVVQKPRAFMLSQNYPNPFNTATAIRYILPRAVHVKLDVYNLLGQKVVTLADEEQEAGYRTVHWDSKDQSGNRVAGGVYFYRLDVQGDFVETKKMILLQ